MFALVALICFILALFHAHVGSVDLVVLGFVFLSLHFLINDTWVARKINTSRQP